MPSPGLPPGHHAASVGALEGGVPWEQGGSLLNRWFETLRAVNFKGRPFFEAAAKSGDAMSAALFSTLTAGIFGLVGVLLIGLLFAFWGSAMLLAVGSTTKGPTAAAGLGVGLIFVIYAAAQFVLSLLVGFVAPWVVGGIHHLVLLMVGGVGQGRDYGHTVRVSAFAAAAAHPWAMIPGVGPMLFLVFYVINHVTGYEAMHGCGSGKASLAALSPVLVCCCCYAGSIFLGVMLAGAR